MNRALTNITAAMRIAPIQLRISFASRTHNFLYISIRSANGSGHRSSTGAT